VHFYETCILLVLMTPLLALRRAGRVGDTSELPLESAPMPVTVIERREQRLSVCTNIVELSHNFKTLPMCPERTISDFILEELWRKLIEKFSFSKRDADLVGAFLRRVGTIVQPADLQPDLCRDPTDVPVRAIPIIRPGEYWRRASEID
jgi:hypothetical protein